MTQAFSFGYESHPLNALRRTGIVQDVSTAATGFINVSLGDDDPSLAVPMTWVAGYLPTVLDIVLIMSAGGDHIIIGSLASIGLGGNRGYIDATSSVDFTLPTATYTELTFDTLTGGGVQSSGAAYLHSTGKIVIPRTGLWIVTAAVLFPTASYTRTIVLTARVGLGGSANAIPTRNDYPTGLNHIMPSATYPQQYNANDVVTAYAYQDSGSSVVLAAHWTHISAYQVA